MCGKFTQMYAWRDVHAFSTPITIPSGMEEIVTSTPMRYAHIMRLNAKGEREMTPMRWGFADKKAASPARPKHMHARAETVDRLPTFSNAFAHGRGILMVKTFNEGEELPSGKTKQWVIAPKDELPIAIAVICESWVNGDEVVDTFIQVTTPANDLISPVTDRMPAVLPPETWATWLGETDASLADIRAVLKTFDDAGSWSIAPQEAPPKKAKPPKDEPQSELF